MAKSLHAVSLLVRDYDEAIRYFRTALRFEVQEDTDFGNGKRWVLLSPGSGSAALLLAKASTQSQIEAIGNQAGGRVFLFLRTKNFWGDFEYMKSQGVEFLEVPRQESYGMVVVFRDLYGNKWDLLEEK